MVPTEPGMWLAKGIVGSVNCWVKRELLRFFKEFVFRQHSVFDDDL